MSDVSEFKKWYDVPKNKKAISDRRKERYRSDPKYREEQLARAQARRDSLASEVAPPPEYVHTLKDVAEACGVSVSTMRYWEGQKFFPRPAMYRGKFLFTETQKDLLASASETFQKGDIKTPALGIEINRVLLNWS